MSARSLLGIRFDAEAVELGEARIVESVMAVMLRFLLVRAYARFLGLVFACDQLAAQELADRRFRDVVDEDVAARPLEIGEAGGAAELVELGVVDRAAALDEGGDDLAPALVGKADHRHFGHGGMQRQAALDLDRRDVLAAGDDHVVDTAGDEQVAVRVEVAGVAGEVPALAQRLGVGFGPPPIAFEGLVAGERR